MSGASTTRFWLWLAVAGASEVFVGALGPAAGWLALALYGEGFANERAANITHQR